ncbi:MAG: hypothetical protein AB1896_23775, partial [Thermodesulfobacteriota bacterium]
MLSTSRLTGRRTAGLLLLIGLLFVGAAQAGQDGRTTIMVLGDSLGDGMYVGLYRAVRDNPNVTVFRLSKIGTGLFNFDLKAWRRQLAQVIATRGPDVAVVMLGGNDPQPIRLPGRERYAFRSEEWRTHYVARLDEYMRSLIDAGLAVFWVGLPSMREPDYDR